MSIENPTNTKEEFSVAGVEHEIIEKYSPEFFAKGGEHFVYEVSEHPDVIFLLLLGKYNPKELHSYDS